MARLLDGETSGIAIDSHTKLIITHHIGARNTVNAYQFVRDLRNTVGQFAPV